MCLFRRNKKVFPITEEDVFKAFESNGLKDVRPRVFMTQDKIKTIKAKIKSKNKVVVRLFENLKAFCDDLLTRDLIVGEKNDDGSFKWNDRSREFESRVIALCLLYKLTDEKKYADRAMEQLNIYMDFPHWQDVHFLDTSIISIGFACAYDWLYDYLTDEQKTQMKNAVKKNAFDTGLDIIINQKTWTGMQNNWIPVCYSGLSIVGLAMFEDFGQEASTIIKYAREAIPPILDYFNPDGACVEGPAYWWFGNMYTIYLMSVMEDILGTNFGLSDHEGFAKCGDYPMYVHGNSGKVFNYGDCVPRLSTTPGYYYLARKYNKPEYGWFQTTYEAPYWYGYSDPLMLLFYDAKLCKKPDFKTTSTDKYFRNAMPIVCMRKSFTDRNTCFAAIKGGNNQLPHSDASLGAYVFDALGERWAADLGPEDYTNWGYWDNHTKKGARWKCYSMRVEAHNCMVFNPDMNCAQELKCHLDFEKVNLSEKESSTMLNMTKAYKSYVKSYKRGIKLYDNKTKLLVQDEVICKKPCTACSFVMTEAKEIELTNNNKTAILKINDKKCVVDIISDVDAKFEVTEAKPLPTSPQNPRNYNRDDYKKLQIKLENFKQGTIGINYTPIFNAKTKVENPELIKIDDWK